MTADTIYHFFDYKSPYAYLAQQDTLALQTDHGLNVVWLPYTLNIPAYLGDASLDGSGQDVIGTRNAHQWRRVKYSYMDCRREANRRGLTIKGPRKIFDSKLAHMAFLFVSKKTSFEYFHNTVFERFWRRDLDIEDVKQLSEIITACDLNAREFTDYCQTEGPDALSRLQQDAEDKGVFGVPSYLYRDELFWGIERLPRLLEATGH